MTDLTREKAKLESKTPRLYWNALQKIYDSSRGSDDSIFEHENRKDFHLQPVFQQPDAREQLVFLE